VVGGRLVVALVVALVLVVALNILLLLLFLWLSMMVSSVHFFFRNSQNFRPRGWNFRVLIRRNSKKIDGCSVNDDDGCITNHDITKNLSANRQH
jgi:hypothetical protein